MLQITCKTLCCFTSQTALLVTAKTSRTSSYEVMRKCGVYIHSNVQYGITHHITPPSAVKKGLYHPNCQFLLENMVLISSGNWVEILAQIFSGPLKSLCSPFVAWHLVPKQCRVAHAWPLGCACPWSLMQEFPVVGDFFWQTWKLVCPTCHCMLTCFFLFCVARHLGCGVLATVPGSRGLPCLLAETFWATAICTWNLGAL